MTHEEPHFDEGGGACMCTRACCSSAADTCHCPDCNRQCGSAKHQEPPPPPPDVLMHLGSHYCTSRTVRDELGDLAGVVRWYPADQSCPTSAARGTSPESGR